MAKQTINVGTSELSGDGESIRSAFVKTNDNFDEVYSDIAALDGSKIVFGDLSVTTASASGAGSLSYDNTTGVFTFTPAAAGFDGDYNSLTNKPTIPTVPTTISAFTNDSGYITGYTVTESDVTSHQAALTITQSQISDLSHFSGDYNDLTNKPLTILSSGTPAFDSGVMFDANDDGSIYSGHVYANTIDGTRKLSLSSDEIFIQGRFNRGNFTYISTMTDPEDGIGSASHIYSLGVTNTVVSAGYSSGTTTAAKLFLRGKDVEIHSKPTTIDPPKIWKFNNTGTITFPDSTTQSTAWTGSITESQISDLGSYLTSEQHGNFTLSSNSITTSNGDDGIDLVINGPNSDPTPAFISRKWRFADTGAIQFLDPFLNTTTAEITTAKVGNWDTAYSWGDHSAAGYITGYTVTESDVTAHEAALSITESQISDLGNYVESDTTGITGADAVTNIVSLTQAEYDAIVTPNASTMYVIVG